MGSFASSSKQINNNSEVIKLKFDTTKRDNYIIFGWIRKNVATADAITLIYKYILCFFNK